MNSRKLFRRWQRRSTGLLDAAKELLRLGATAGEAEHIHQLRVTLRRLRLMLRLGRPCLGRATVAAFRAWSRRGSKATSPVRDLDVTLDWLRLHPDGVAIMKRLGPQRQRRWKSCFARFLPIPPELRAQLARPKGRRDERARLVRNYEGFQAQHEDAAFRAVPRFFVLSAAEQHAFRRTVRRLRYLRELGLPRREQRGDRLLKQLVHLQEALGEYQNCLVTQSILARLKPKPSLQTRGLRAALGAEAARWQEEIRHELRTLARVEDWKTLAFSTGTQGTAAQTAPRRARAAGTA